MSPGYLDALAAAERRLDHFEAADAEVRSDERDHWTSFELRGTYLSRDTDVPSGPLDLYGAVRVIRPNVGPKVRAAPIVEVQLRDQTKLFGNDTYRFNERAPTFEAAFEAAFVDLCKTYPEGKLAVMAEELVADAFGPRPLGRALGFELATTSSWKRLTGAARKPIVQLAEVALMIFVPELAPVVIAVNVADDVDDIVTRYENHTLTLKTLGLSLADIGLNILPFAKGAKLVQTSRGALAAIEVAIHGGMVALMAVQTRQAIVDIQEQDIVALAEMYREYVALAKSSNPNDPALAQRRAEIDHRVVAVRNRTIEVWQQALKDTSVFFVANHAMGSLGARRRAASMHTAPRREPTVQPSPNTTNEPSADGQLASHPASKPPIEVARAAEKVPSSDTNHNPRPMASPEDQQVLDRVIALDPHEGRRLIDKYGKELLDYLRTNPLTTLKDLDTTLAKLRGQVTGTVVGVYEGIDSKPPAGWTFSDHGKEVIIESNGTRVINSECRRVATASVAWRRFISATSKTSKRSSTFTT